MDVVRRQTAPPPPPSSRLNPDAPVFIPMAYYDAVEDFSDQWWSLVRSSPWFRDYWLTECFQDPEADLFFPDPDSFFDDYLKKQEEEQEERRRSERDLISASALRGNNGKSRGRRKTPRYSEKAPKVINLKVSPRPIQQPR